MGIGNWELKIAEDRRSIRKTGENGRQREAERQNGAVRPIDIVGKAKAEPTI